MKKKTAKAIAKIAEKVTEINVNTSCLILAYQDKLPKSAKKLRKF